AGVELAFDARDPVPDGIEQSRVDTDHAGFVRERQHTADPAQRSFRSADKFRGRSNGIEDVRAFDRTDGVLEICRECVECNGNERLFVLDDTNDPAHQASTSDTAVATRSAISLASASSGASTITRTR